jgi:protein farnesyltransferase/geranylgeranyltransferase type-1 subunit alpha|tara:strand:- start:6683 stop:7219 length:537 start_codon:yes stop_codon:yes gene_type:complete
LAFTEQKIEQDVRNNSAWTERFVVAFGVWDDCGGDTKRERGSDDFSKIVTDEIAFAETRIAMAPDNESAWSYLRGIARLSACRYDRNIQTRVEGIARGFARGFSDAKLEAESVDGAGEKNDVDVDATASQKTCRQALSFLCEILGDSAEKELMLKTLLEIDPIRGNYWAWKSGGGAAC